MTVLAKQLLDKYFPDAGPCAFCGNPLGARHRTIDSIASRLVCGETAESLAIDYGITIEAIRAACIFATEESVQAARFFAGEPNGQPNNS